MSTVGSRTGAPTLGSGGCSELHATLQVSFGWSDQHLYCFQIRGWQFGDSARAIELALAGGGVDIPLAAFGVDIGEPFLYQYNLLVPWEIECRIEARGLIRDTQPVTCLAARCLRRTATRRTSALKRVRF